MKLLSTNTSREHLAHILGLSRHTIAKVICGQKHSPTTRARFEYYFQTAIWQDQPISFDLRLTLANFLSLSTDPLCVSLHLLDMHGRTVGIPRRRGEKKLDFILRLGAAVKTAPPSAQETVVSQEVVSTTAGESGEK